VYELIRVGERTYYVDCPVRMGIYLSERGACLIDGGSDREAGKKLLKILDQNGWKPGMILNTHSHADHIGGDRLIQQRSGCPVYAPGVDRALVEFPMLEPSFLYGGFPPKPLRNKFLLAEGSAAGDLTEEALPEGLSMLRLDGHSMAMAAFRTDDGVWFLGDSLTSEAVLQKYHVSFLYDVKGFLDSLDAVEALEGRLFIPSHAFPVEDVHPLVKLNRDKTMEVLELVLALCSGGTAFEEILKGVFDHYNLTMDFNQYVLVGSTVRSYLSYLMDGGRVEACFDSNRLLWRAVQGQ
jgi:glyoxylase-like metal-dependent hydrolase (beta-lactamase superfamily II)